MSHTRSGSPLSGVRVRDTVRSANALIIGRRSRLGPLRAVRILSLSLFLYIADLPSVSVFPSRARSRSQLPRIFPIPETGSRARIAHSFVHSCIGAPVAMRDPGSELHRM